MPILHWLDKDDAVTQAQRCAYRLLEEVPELSYGDTASGNLLVQGDNLEALKALIPFYAGQVKCIYIDPPYNTRSAFEHYDDNLEHSKWLSLIYPRLELLRELLAEDGSIWVSIDDNEAHYLKVIMDEIFGRKNFVANSVWQKKSSPQPNAVWLSDCHEHILAFAKNKDVWRPNKLPRNDQMDDRYKNLDNDPRGRWTSGDCTISLTGGQRGAQFAKTGYSENIYEIKTPSGRVVTPPSGNCWRFSKQKFLELAADNRLWFGTSGNNVPRLKRFLSEVQSGVVPHTWWTREDVGDNQQSKREVTKFNAKNVFSTPKPERLIERIILIATNPDDLILDSFLGSGTTAAVAHKMGRRYIGIEIGEHAQTHCQPRLKKVVDGEQGGISKAIEWQGGGGFRFYQLGQPVFDDYGSLNPEIKFNTLASHLWYLETKTPLNQKAPSAFLGVSQDIAYYLLYNGILGDRRPDGGNVLTSSVLNGLPDIHDHQGRKIVIYGESTRLGEGRLKQANITFKQIPYDVGAL